MRLGGFLTSFTRWLRKDATGSLNSTYGDDSAELTNIFSFVTFPLPSFRFQIKYYHKSICCLFCFIQKLIFYMYA